MGTNKNYALHIICGLYVYVCMYIHTIMYICISPELQGRSKSIKEWYACMFACVKYGKTLSTC